MKILLTIFGTFFFVCFYGFMIGYIGGVQLYTEQAGDMAAMTIFCAFCITAMILAIFAGNKSMLQ